VRKILDTTPVVVVACPKFDQRKRPVWLSIPHKCPGCGCVFAYDGCEWGAGGEAIARRKLAAL